MARIYHTNPIMVCYFDIILFLNTFDKVQFDPI